MHLISEIGIPWRTEETGFKRENIKERDISFLLDTYKGINNEEELREAEKRIDEVIALANPYCGGKTVLSGGFSGRDGGGGPVSFSTASLLEAAGYIEDTAVRGGVLIVDLDDTLLLPTLDYPSSDFIRRRYHMIKNSIQHNIDSAGEIKDPEEFRIWMQEQAAWLKSVAMKEYADVEGLGVRLGIYRKTEGADQLLKTAERLGLRIIVLTGRDESMKAGTLAALKSADMDIPEKNIRFCGYGEGKKAEMLAAELNSSRAPPALYYIDDSSFCVDEIRGLLQTLPLQNAHIVHLISSRSRFSYEYYLNGINSRHIAADSPAGRDEWHLLFINAIRRDHFISLPDGGSAASFTVGLVGSLDNYLGPGYGVVFLFVTVYFIAGNIKHYRDCVRLQRIETACSMDIHSFSLKRFVFDVFLNLVFIDYVCMFVATYLFQGQLSWMFSGFFALARIDFMFLSVSYLILFGSEMFRYLLARAAGVKEFVFIVQGKYLRVAYPREAISDAVLSGKIRAAADMSGIAFSVALTAAVAAVIGINELFIGGILILLNEMNRQRDYLPEPLSGMFESMEALGIRFRVLLSGFIFKVYIPVFIYLKIITEWVRKILRPVAAWAIRLKTRLTGILLKVYAPFYIRSRILQRLDKGKRCG
jgi:hypothetical protein